MITFKSNIIQTIFRQIIGIGLGFALLTIIARTLGPEGNGVYGTVIIFITILATFLNFGLTSSNVYFISRQRSILPLAFKSSLLSWFSLSIIGCIIAFFVVFLSSNRIFPDIPIQLLYISIIAFPILLFNNIMLGIFQATENFKYLNLVTLLPIIINLLSLVIVAIFVHINITSALACYIFAQLIVSIAITYLIKYKLSLNLDEIFSIGQIISYIRDVAKYSTIAHASNVVTYLNYRADFYIVISILGPAAAGIYFLAVQIVERLWIVAQSISYVMLPKLASGPRSEDAKRLAIRLASISLGLTFILACVVAFVSVKYLSNIFGNSYDRASIPVMILLPGIILGSLSKIFSNVMAAYGEVKINLWVAILLLFVNIALSLNLTRNFGLGGAALATSISYAIDGILKTVLGLRFLRTTIALQPSYSEKT